MDWDLGLGIDSPSSAFHSPFSTLAVSLPNDRYPPSAIRPRYVTGPLQNDLGSRVVRDLHQAGSQGVLVAERDEGLRSLRLAVGSGFRNADPPAIDHAGDPADNSSSARRPA